MSENRLQLAEHAANRSLSFREELSVQRWDDHRYYHQSRINQSLHLVSAISFMSAYVLAFTNLSAAVLIGWMVAMITRQAGHFFFEPRDYDKVNDASHEHKESIKVGFNLSRKRALHAVWAAIPVALYFSPSFFGLLAAGIGWEGFLQNTALLWFWLALIALVLRTAWLAVIQSPQTGLVWLTKILTDPFNDFRTYLKSPIYLFKGELLDPMQHVDRVPATCARD